MCGPEEWPSRSIALRTEFGLQVRLPQLIVNKLLIDLASI
jgi:hypothetical protein